MAYKAYLITSLGAPRDHHAIFIETHEDGSGHIFQVTGNIQAGMTLGHRPGMKPEDEVGYVDKTYLGAVSTENYTRVEEIVDGVEVPTKQFDGPKRLDPKTPLRRCNEWAAEAIEALRGAGVLEA